MEERNLIGVEYPGRVENVDNMIRSLGGLTNISKVVCNMDKKRLDLKFRPDDVYSKPIYGDLKSSSGLLIKVVKRRRKPNVAGPSNSDSIDEPTIEILGIVRSMFKFEGKLQLIHSSNREIQKILFLFSFFSFKKGLCDYQYLPLAKHPTTNETIFIYDEIMPKSVVSPDWLM